MFQTVTASFVFTQGRFSQLVLVSVHCCYNNIILVNDGFAEEAEGHHKKQGLMICCIAFVTRFCFVFSPVESKINHFNHCCIIYIFLTFANVYKH